MVPNARENADNEDICAVLGRLLSATTVDVAELAELAAFELDHAHHAERLPQLLRELSTPRAA
jgi:hypothetical protein